MNAPTPELPTAASVDAAAQRLKGVAVRTPLVFSPVLSERTGARVFLKPETLQRTGSFKFRGAYNRMVQIPEGNAQAGWWPAPPVIMPRAWRPPRGCWACPPSSSCPMTLRR